MKKCSFIKVGLLIGTIILLISSIVAPMAIGYNFSKPDNEMLVESYKFDRYLYPEFYDYYNIDEIPDSEKYINREHPDNDNIQPEIVINIDNSQQTLDGPPIDSPWPMYCHDVRHTGRSSYSTASNLGDEKWRFATNHRIEGDSVVDDVGTIYFGSGLHLYAIYLNGTLKWKFETNTIDSTPAIDRNGVIYVGTAWTAGDCYLYAIYPNGTLKWKYRTGGENIFGSPAIGDDSTIYFGTGGGYPWYGYINAMYSNGTIRWKYKTGHEVFSAPAIGDDGTVYCGSHDNYLYALYPNNGTLKWKYKTGDWIRVSPCIADDSTIYVVSLDNYLHAVYPNGTLKWKTDVGAGTSPTIGQDGTIYCGYTKLHAVNPSNGTIKWKFAVGGKIRGATPCNSIDGTIYLGNSEGSDIVAVNPDGTEKWRKSIGGDVESAPAIGEDGTVYIGDGRDDGCLHAFGPLDSNAPSAPEIDGPTSGRVRIEYEFTFKSTSPLGNDVYYWIEWGDNRGTGWIGPYSSGEEITESHTWSSQGTYTIKARAKDTDNLWGPWGYFEVEIPRNKVSYNSFFLRFLERFPLMERLFSLIK